MRRIAIVIALVLGIGTANAQQDWGSGILVNAGTSVGVYGFGLGSAWNRTSSSLPLTGSVEIGVGNDISVGPWFGLYSSSYRYYDGFANYDYDYTVSTFGAKGTYHATNVLNEELGAGLPTELDVYGSLYTGFTTGRYSTRTVGGADFGNSFAINFGAVIGVRYMLVNNIGVFAETGRGALGWFTGGLSLKF